MVLKTSAGHKMSTHGRLAEQERKWRDSVDAIDWLDEVDSFAAITKLHKWGSQVQHGCDEGVGCRTKPPQSTSVMIKYIGCS